MSDAEIPVDPRRSALMRRVRSKNSTPERIVRSALHREGFRFRIHDKSLPGCPDIVFPARRAVVFVHGCFWHRHAGCRATSTPNTRQEFWQAKFARNVERDARTSALLEAAGWAVHVVWECETKKDGTYPPPLLQFLARYPPVHGRRRRNDTSQPPVRIETSGRSRPTLRRKAPVGLPIKPAPSPS